LTLYSISVHFLKTRKERKKKKIGKKERWKKDIKRKNITFIHNSCVVEVQIIYSVFGPIKDYMNMV
jgi:hypothetical protein